MSDHKKLFIDYSQCIGCETCEAVCRFVNDLPRLHMTRTRDGVMLPVYCQHCEEPHCARACPRGAIVRDREGAVILQPMLCRGCETRQCIMGCLHSAIFETDQGVMVTKCDLCAPRRALGLPPACVAMCPTGAIRFVSAEEAEAAQTEASREARRRLEEHIRPALGPAGGKEAGRKSRG
jgi:Fe-S-cluster-containing dehydrogenase component